MIPLLQQAEQQEGSVYVQSALTYLATTGRIDDNKAFFETIHDHLSAETETNVMTLIDHLVAQKTAELIAKAEAARLEGAIDTKKAIARKLLQQGLSIEQISESTTLSVAEVQMLCDELYTH